MGVKNVLGDIRPIVVTCDTDAFLVVLQHLHFGT
jgi:hypothetical protein